MEETESESLIVGFGSAEYERLQFASPRPIFLAVGFLYDDWLEPTASVHAGPFSVAARAYVSASNFMRLLPQLRGLTTHSGALRHSTPSSDRLASRSPA